MAVGLAFQLDLELQAASLERGAAGVPTVWVVQLNPAEGTRASLLPRPSSAGSAEQRPLVVPAVAGP